MAWLSSVLPFLWQYDSFLLAPFEDTGLMIRAVLPAERYYFRINLPGGCF